MVWRPIEIEKETKKKRHKKTSDFTGTPSARGSMPRRPFLRLANATHTPATFYFFRLFHRPHFDFSHSSKCPSNQNVAEETEKGHLRPLSLSLSSFSGVPKRNHRKENKKITKRTTTLIWPAMRRVEYFFCFIFYLFLIK